MIGFDDIKTSCRFVAENADDVSIDADNLKKFAAAIKPAALKHWLEGSCSLPVGTPPEKALIFPLLVDSAVFCFWKEPKWRKISAGKTLGGSLSLVKCYTDALNAGLDLLSPQTWLDMTFDDYKNLMRGDTGTELIMLDQRFAFLQKNMRTLLEKYDGSALDFTGQGASGILNALISQFSGFDDICAYKGRPVYLLKRAQLAISDLDSFCRKYFGRPINGAEKLVACPDYKLPQILRRHGVLNYTPKLSELVDNKKEIPFGSPMEVELRASTLHAVGLITEEFNKRHPDTPRPSIEINDLVWTMSQNDATPIKPHHRTLTHFY
jgi:hypothetical protein